MLAIKLQRIGKKHQPSYRVVVAEKKSKMAGPPIEDLGFYSSFTKQATLKKDRIEHWLKVGAQPTVTAHNLLVKEGISKEAKIKVKMKAKPVEPAAPAPASAPAATPAAEAPAQEVAAPVAPQAEEVQETAQ